MLSKLKKLILIILLLLTALCITSSYLVSWYCKQKHDNFADFIRNAIPGSKVTSHMQLGYWQSLLMTKIELPQGVISNNIGDNFNHLVDIKNVNSKNKLTKNITNNTNKINNNILNNNVIFKNLFTNTLTLQHKIFYKPTKCLVTINTKVLTGLPKFIKNLNLVTTINFKGKITTTIEDIDLNYILSLDNNNLKSLVAEKALIYVNNDNENLLVKFQFPKLIYKEENNIIDVDNFKLNIKLKNFNSLNECRIKFLTEIDTLYLIANNDNILRLTNFSMEQKISDQISSNVSFLKLNILDEKIGPLVTKLQLYNITCAKILKHFNYLKLPFNQEKFTPYKFIESVNQLFNYKPSLSLDLLMHLGKNKLQFLSDIMLDQLNPELSNKEDIFNSVTANIFAKVPKIMMLDLMEKLVEYQQKKKIQSGSGYLSYDYKKLLSNNEIESLVLEKMEYLINHNILKEDNDDFIVNLTIAEGIFFSKDNPFKIFSF